MNFIFNIISKYSVYFLVITFLSINNNKQLLIADNMSDLFDENNVTISNVNNLNDNDNGIPKWTKAKSFQEVYSGCISPSPNGMLNSKTKKITLPKDNNTWINTGVRAQKGGMISISSDIIKITELPEKYKLLVRFDPRFDKPQIFIKKYNYKTEKYICDFDEYRNGILTKYQADLLSSKYSINQRLKNYVDYFNFISRDKIPVKAGQIVNIVVDDKMSFFDGNCFNTEKLSRNNLISLETSSPLENNKIAYINAKTWCNNNNNDSCWTGKNELGEDAYYIRDVPLRKGHSIDASRMMVGLLQYNLSNAIVNKCDLKYNEPLDNNKLCYDDSVKGLEIKINDTIIKSSNNSFNKNNGQYFIYYKAKSDGDLDFNFNLNKTTYSSSQSLMKNWNGDFDKYKHKTNNQYSYTTLAIVKWIYNQYYNDDYFASFNDILVGRYFFNITVGSKDKSNNIKDNNLKISYVIRDDNDIPLDSTQGYTIDNNSLDDKAYNDGFIWIKVNKDNLNNKDNSIIEEIDLTISSYDNYIKFSELIYDDFIKPLKNQFNNIVITVYENIITDNYFRNIVLILMSLYVAITGLSYITGINVISFKMSINSIIKLIIVTILISPTSWNFFNNYLFDIFLNGTDYLINMINKNKIIHNSEDNLFGFIDPLIGKYTHPDLWKMLLASLLQFGNGMFIFAGIMIYSILLYLRVIIEIIISYCLAFIGMSILISLAPVFIVFTLFNYTRSFFDNWISKMFSYVIEPTILIIFFLFIDQLMETFIFENLVPICWEKIIDLSIHVNLHHIYIPLEFDINIPYIDGIYFFVPEYQKINNADDFINSHGTFSKVITSSLLFFIYARMCKGIIEYTTIVTQYLTNVSPARQDGKKQSNANPTHDIMSDMKNAVSPITNSLSSVKSFASRKFLNQKIDDENLNNNLKKNNKGSDIDKLFKADDNSSENNEENTNETSDNKKENNQNNSNDDNDKSDRESENNTTQVNDDNDKSDNKKENK
ncbi:MAG TPA: type IV secretion system protein [Candidatus Megaira endosymbiont of Hartmannula sinica]|nr:type IV secretion system protein [Candidatus Megaera endosymbiont of Hartmannula sinica]